VLALQFLQEKYELTYKPHVFVDYLVKSWDIIIAHTALHP
jgi:hypothetical protein